MNYTKSALALIESVISYVQYYSKYFLHIFNGNKLWNSELRNAKALMHRRE